MRKEPSARVLRRLIDYDPATGAMTWKERPVWMFQHGRHGRVTSARVWNAKFAGKPAFDQVHLKGYKVGGMLGLKFTSHRIAWAIHHGEWPEDQIDHINGVRTDNRLENLRDVSQDENMRNRKRPKSNSTGFVGISRNAKDGGYRVDISGAYVGYFQNLEDAVQARKLAAQRLDYHPNHGRAA